MKQILLAAILLFPAIGFAQTSTVKMATYNVDGLPNSLSLLGFDITINEDGPGETGSPLIGQKLEDSGWDIIGMNEDFNFHELITSKMTSYDFQTYGGNISVSAAAVIGVIAQTWRFDSDGLELATKKGITVKNETIVPWRDDAVYGYFSNDNDSLTKKGFRYYTVTTADNYDIDVIILHADAGDTDKPDFLARENGMDQLFCFIKDEVKTQNPLVVMGDYNCFYERDRLQELFIDRINNNLTGVKIEDAGREMGAEEDLDKILYMNRNSSEYILKPTASELVKSFTYDDGTQLSDHYPLCATFSIEVNPVTGIAQVESEKTSTTRKYVENGRLVIVKDGKKFSASGQSVM